MIGIVDYDAGNVRSVMLALDFLGLEYRISKKPVELETADRLLFPGVGDARFAMEQLKRSGFDAFLKDYAASGRPLLGICLGSQIIFDYSEEENTPCLGLIKGSIRHFSALYAEQADKMEKPGLRASLKVPHMGWNDIGYANPLAPCALFSGIPDHSSYYFVHSYVIQPEDPGVIAAAAEYGIPVPAAIRKDNIYALQFHPEKSGKHGLAILKNFAEL